ncbi:PREDICTED: nidogen-2 [Nicrophorus vespilloides]|uniref:Nidogen-2 n=1 Tax=Nicrophorus vespilloides TaxID=110193 RepID=A0ABM1MMB3_NICVS|nr:PREDICTED: nidogen-2 [Nicrophorus vespilloides]
MHKMHTLLWGFVLIALSRAIPESLIYPPDGTPLEVGDDVSINVELKNPIIFYGTKYDTIFINTNGLLSFGNEFPTFFNIEFPLDYPIVAPFYSNVDTTKSGNISYYETTDRHLLDRAKSTVRDAFTNSNFIPISIFVVTWNKVGYYKAGNDYLNTFQVAIYIGNTDCFVEFLYPENGIQWIQGTGDESGLPDARSQVGFISADRRFYLLPGSGNDRVRFLEKRSNMKLPGQWLFQVGNLGIDENVVQPNIHITSNQQPQTCANATTQCNIQAKCTDYTAGFCCSCKNNFYGNGLNCIKKDVPLRVNGKVKATLNGLSIETLDLQSYVVMSDGRSYTAMSKIPEPIGPNIQSLQILGSTIGWLFARPVGNSLNGFQLTGGIFNHTAVITFPNTNDSVTIRQKYLGLDVFDQLKLETIITGDIPQIPNVNIDINEYQEEYTYTSPGVVQSSANHAFVYSFNKQVIEEPYHIVQTITFDYCKHEELPLSTVWKLKVGKNFISYESREQIVRYGMSNKITPFEEYDPCLEGHYQCGPNSACVVDGDSFNCLCTPGYQQILENELEVCVDVNECNLGIHDCDYNSKCINEVGSYRCECNPGFVANGKICENAKSCNNVQCNTNAECVQRGTIAVCTCSQGYTGNGQICTAIKSQSCHIMHNCSPYAYCQIDEEVQTYKCYCLPAYDGDGYTCVPSKVNKEIERCIMGVCTCPPGMRKEPNTKYCIEIQYTTPAYEENTEINASEEDELEQTTLYDSCNILNNCHSNAQCIYVENMYKCVCNTGYEGNGIDCSETYQCSQESCDEHATCTYNEDYGKSMCVCNEGFSGNGYSCYIETADACTSDYDCLENEMCRYINESAVMACICRDGLERDSQQHCVAIKGTCGGGTCVENAECIYDEEIDTYYCNCKKDFVGSGITECRPRPVGCNVDNNCGLHATCSYNSYNGSYECVCSEGFHGDGFICYAENNCHIDPSICHPNAVCVTNANRKYICECNSGFLGNGTICHAAPKHEGNFLLVNQGIATLKVPYERSRYAEGKPIQLKYFQLAVGLDVDCFAGRVYWSDINFKAIRSSSYTGSNKIDFITKDIGSPEGLAIDWISRNIYWTDSTKDIIGVANLDSKLRKTLFNTGLVNPRGIVVHPQRGKIFWSDWDRNKPKIEWANADGSGREIFLQGSHLVHLPNSLTIDYYTEQLCYADAGIKKIMCVDIDTKEPREMAINCTYPFGISATESNIYWSDWISKKIEGLDKYTLKRIDPPLEVPLGGTGNKLYGLVSVPDSCPELSNVCMHKDQCPENFICLPDGKGSRSCVCGNKIDSFEKNCLE